MVMPKADVVVFFWPKEDYVQKVKMKALKSSSIPLFGGGKESA